MTYFHIFHKDLAQTLSNHSLDQPENGLIFALRYYYLGILKRLPQLDDFKINTKYKPLEEIKTKENDNLAFSKDILLYNLNEVSLCSISLGNEFPLIMKQASIIYFVRNVLNLCFLEKEYNDSRFLSLQNLFSKNISFHYISCKVFSPTSLLEIQRSFYSDRKSLCFQDFFVIEKDNRHALAAVCSHKLSIDIISNSNISWNKIYQEVIQSHIRNCLSKEVDPNGLERHKLENNLELAEKKLDQKCPLPWPRDLRSPGEEMKIKFREKWKQQHPYFGKQEYKPMVMENLNCSEYPEISTEGKERLPPCLIEIYKTYASATPLVCAPPSLNEAKEFLRITITNLYECFRNNEFETVSFTCVQYCTIPELMKLAVDPPLPRKMLLHPQSQQPIYKYAHIFQSSIIQPQCSIYRTITTGGLYSALYLLSCITVWHIFPNPQQSKKNKKSKSTSTSSSTSLKISTKLTKNKTEEKETKFKVNDLLKSFYLITVDLNIDLEKLYIPYLEKVEKMKSILIKIFPGSSPKYKKVKGGEGEKENKYEDYLPPNKYQLYKKINAKPCTKHVTLKTKEEMDAFFLPMMEGSGFRFNTFCDLSLAISAYDVLVNVNAISSTDSNQNQNMEMNVFGLG